MRRPFLLAVMVVTAACAGKSNAAHPGAPGDSGGAPSSAARVGSGGSGTAMQTAAQGGAGAPATGGPSRVMTSADGGGGVGGTSPAVGSGGQTGRDAGQGGAGHSGHDGGQGGASGQTGTGGSAGGGGTPGDTCDQFARDYDAAMQIARMCDPHATGQCQQLVVRSLGCYCTTYVNDFSTLNSIKAKYDQAGCPPDPACRGIACTSPGTMSCMSIDIGDVCD